MKWLNMMRDHCGIQDGNIVARMVEVLRVVSDKSQDVEQVRDEAKDILDDIGDPTGV